MGRRAKEGREDDNAVCNPHAVSSLPSPSSTTTWRATHCRVIAFFSLFNDDVACNPHTMSSLSSPSSTTIQRATHHRVVAFFSRFDDDMACNPHTVSLLSSPALMTIRRAIHTPCHCFLLPLQRRYGVQSTRSVVAFFSRFDDNTACNPHAVSLLSSPSSTMMRRAIHMLCRCFLLPLQ